MNIEEFKNYLYNSIAESVVKMQFEALKRSEGKPELMANLYIMSGLTSTVDSFTAQYDDYKRAFLIEGEGEFMDKYEFDELVKHAVHDNSLLNENSPLNAYLNKEELVDQVVKPNRPSNRLDSSRRNSNIDPIAEYAIEKAEAKLQNKSCSVLLLLPLIIITSLVIALSSY